MFAFFRKVSPLFLLLILFCVSQSQNRSKPKAMLAKERANLEEKITLVNKLLTETASKTQKSRTELAVLNNQIQLREQLISTLENEIAVFEDEIALSEERICYMEEDLVKLRRLYAQTVRVAYLNLPDSYSWLMIFGANGFREAYNRFVYLFQYAQYRKRQIKQIVRTETEIAETIQARKAMIVEHEAMINEKLAEVDKLTQSKTTKASVYESLRSQEANYRQELAAQQAQLKQVIESLNLAEAPLPSPTPKKSEGKMAAKSEKTNIYENDGKSFDKKKGHIPWPVPANKAIVVEKFGDSEDEYGNKVSNAGIKLRVSQGQQVVAVHEGIVTAVHEIPLSGTIVIMAHGKYRTAYANLDQIKVKKGDAVKAGQALGSVRTDSRTDEAITEFMVMITPNKYLNPLLWLAK